MQNLALLDVAFSAFPDHMKGTMLYAHLHNSAALSLFERNDLHAAGQHLEVTQKIRETLLDPDQPDTEEELSNVYNNLGLVASAAGQLDDALHFLGRALELRVGLGEAAHLPSIVTKSELRAHIYSQSYDFGGSEVLPSR